MGGGSENGCCDYTQRGCQKFQENYRYFNDSEKEAIVFLRLRKEGCEKKPALNFSAKNVCRSDSTRTFFGPPKFRMLKVRKVPSYTLQKGWLEGCISYDMDKDHFLSYKDFIEEDEQNERLQTIFDKDEESAKQEFKKMLAVMRAYFEGMSNQFNVPRAARLTPASEHLARVKQHCLNLRNVMHNSTYFELANVKFYQLSQMLQELKEAETENPEECEGIILKYNIFNDFLKEDEFKNAIIQRENPLERFNNHSSRKQSLSSQDHIAISTKDSDQKRSQLQQSPLPFLKSKASLPLYFADSVLSDQQSTNSESPRIFSAGQLIEDTIDETQANEQHNQNNNNSSGGCGSYSQFSDRGDSNQAKAKVNLRNGSSSSSSSSSEAEQSLNQQHQHHQSNSFMKPGMFSSAAMQLDLLSELDESSDDLFGGSTKHGRGGGGSSVRSKNISMISGQNQRMLEQQFNQAQYHFKSAPRAETSPKQTPLESSSSLGQQPTHRGGMDSSGTRSAAAKKGNRFTNLLRIDPALEEIYNKQIRNESKAEHVKVSMKKQAIVVVESDESKSNSPSASPFSTAGRVSKFSHFKHPMNFNDAFMHIHNLENEKQLQQSEKKQTHHFSSLQEQSQQQQKTIEIDSGNLTNLVDLKQSMMKSFLKRNFRNSSSSGSAAILSKSLSSFREVGNPLVFRAVKSKMSSEDILTKSKDSINQKLKGSSTNGFALNSAYRSSPQSFRQPKQLCKNPFESSEILLNRDRKCEQPNQNKEENGFTKQQSKITTNNSSSCSSQNKNKESTFLPPNGHKHPPAFDKLLTPISERKNAKTTPNFWPKQNSNISSSCIASARTASTTNTGLLFSASSSTTRSSSKNKLISITKQ